jgi:outer membrane protein OmpA-like peptidoglycan-associated protein
MKKSIQNFFLFAFISATSIAVNAQNYLGVHSSNYAGVMGLDNQPASFVDGRFKVDINLFSYNLGAWQNAKYFDATQLPKWWKKSLSPDILGTSAAGTDSTGYVAGGSNTYNDWMVPDSNLYNRTVFDYVDYNSSTKARGIYLNSQLDILNFAFHLKPTIAIGFSIKSRMITNVTDIDPKLAKLAENGLDFSQLWNLQLNDKLLDINMMAWNEYGFNYGQVVADKGKHFFKVGGRIKLLQGIASAYAYTDQIDYNLINKDSALNLAGSFRYGYSSNLDQLNQSFNPLQSSSKLGLGLDLGVVYEWRPKYKQYKYDMDNKTDLWTRSKEKYELRLGASIVDIGGMRFTKGGLSRNFSVNTTNFDLRVFNDATSFASFDSIVDSLITSNSGWTANDEIGKTYYMNTPTALSLQADYHIWNHFYVNATGMINVLGKRNDAKVRVPNQFSITPSFDHAWFGLYVPVSVNNYSGWKVGLASRLGPLTIGVIDCNSLFARGKVHGTEFYAGLRVPILYTEPEDRDLDKVSDKLDACKEIPGVWAFKGCPDRDGDGIQDTEDLCPDTPGLAEFKGCPDKDGDKIPDKDDACPDLAGLVQFKGCPDRDNDSIIDTQDECPDVAGLKAFNGCPDKDGDGIKDSDDACPDVPGPIANQGCPDTDNDGLFDFVDNCPTEFGPKENNGCPWPDTDKDGLIDKDDECPYLAGPLKNKGCPYQDTDGDGILDKDDDCPTVKGVIENKGCPKIEQEAQEILNTAFENLEFNTGNAIIKDVSFASLNDLAALLIKKKDWKLQIAGHTDNVGDAQKNLVLSKQRSEAVKAYLVSKGVEASRLNALFFGETQPIATNDTAEGRQKNRRVEMTVVFQ